MSVVAVLTSSQYVSGKRVPWYLLFHGSIFDAAHQLMRPETNGFHCATNADFRFSTECYSCCADSTDRCGGYFRLSMYQIDGPRFSPKPQESPCTFNGIARAPLTRVATTDSTGGVTEYTSTGPTQYGPLTTGTTEFPVTTTDSAGVTTVYTTTQPLCEGGNCAPNQHMPGGSMTSTRMPSYTAAPLATPLVVSGCNWVGCYDDDGPPRALDSRNDNLDRNLMTIDLCVSVCLGRGFTYAGVEYGSECYCDNAIQPPHQLASGNTAAGDILITCSDPEFACNGNRTQMCGGFAAMGIYYCPANAPNTTASETFSGKFSFPQTGWVC